MTGALSLMTTQAFSKAVNNFLEPATGFVAAVLASSGHRSPLTMAAVNQLFAVHLIRFQRPHGFNQMQVACIPVTSSCNNWLQNLVLLLRMLAFRS